MALDKDWRNAPDETTPLSAAAIEDFESRVKDYVDDQVALASAPSELGYAEITADQNFTTIADVTGLSVTVTATGRPVVLVCDAQFYLGIGGAIGSLYLYEGATMLQQKQKSLAGSFTYDEIAVYRRLVPSAGSHTYKVRASCNSGSIFLAAAADKPIGFHVYEV